QRKVTRGEAEVGERIELCEIRVARIGQQVDRTQNPGAGDERGGNVDVVRPIRALKGIGDDAEPVNSGDVVVPRNRVAKRRIGVRVLEVDPPLERVYLIRA